MNNQSYNGQSDDSFLRTWWRSRDWFKFLVAFPALFVLVALGVIGDWVLNAEQNSIPAYSQELANAIIEEDDRRAEIAVNTLLQLRPQDRLLKYQLAQLRFRQERFANGFSLMQNLAAAKDPRACMWLARVLFEKAPTDTNLEKAAELLQEVLQREPKNAHAHALLGETYQKLGQWKLAAPELEAAAKLEPHYWLKFAKLSARRGNSDAARERAKFAEQQLSKLVAETPGDTARRVQWSESLRVQGKLNDALIVIREGLRLAPQAESLRNECSRVLLDQADAERVGGIVDFARYSKLLQQSLHFNPANRTALQKLVDIPLEEHTLDQELLATIQATLPEQPAATSDCVFAAWIRLQKDQADPEVFPLLERAAVSKPSANLLIARFQKFLGREKSAQETATRFLETLSSIEEPNVADVLNKAATLVFLNDHAGAIAALDVDDRNRSPLELSQLRNARTRYMLSEFQSLQKTSNNPARRLSLARELLDVPNARRLAIAGLGQLAAEENNIGQQATAVLEQLLVNGRDALQIHTQFGTNALVEKNYSLAAEHLDQALTHAPNDPFLCNNLAWSLLHRKNSGDAERALKLSTRALSRLPENPTILQTRGKALIELQRYQDALHDLETALNSAGNTDNSHDVHASLAIVYRELGNEGLAKRHLARATKPN